MVGGCTDNVFVYYNKEPVFGEKRYLIFFVNGFVRYNVFILIKMFVNGWIG